MNIKENKWFLGIDSKRSKFINGIYFTDREIDIVSCIISGRSSITISTFLSISPRTVETHIRNIMGKLNCNSRQRVLSYIENSEYAVMIREHYELLQKENKFTKILDYLSINNFKLKENVFITVFKEEHKEMSALLENLINHLKYIGIYTKKSQAMSCLSNQQISLKQKHFFYLCSNNLETKSKKVEPKDTNVVEFEISKIFIQIEKFNQNKYMNSSIQNSTFILLNNYENYSDFFLDFIQHLLSENDVVKIKKELKNLNFISTINLKFLFQLDKNIFKFFILQCSSIKIIACLKSNIKLAKFIIVFVIAIFFSWNSSYQIFNNIFSISGDYQFPTSKKSLLDLANRGAGLNDSHIAELARNHKNLDLRNSKIGYIGAIELARSTVLEILNLEGLHTGDLGAIALASSTSIKKLILKGTHLGDDCTKALAANTTITYLDLSNNHIGDIGAGNLTANTSFEHLILKNTDIGHVGKELLKKRFGNRVEF